MSTATLTRLKIDRKALVDAHGRVAGVIPARSPKPVLQSCLLRIDGDGLATLTATDLEVGIVTPLSGVESDGAASVLLSARAWAALKSLDDDTVTMEVSDGALTIRGQRSRFAIPTDDPDLYPTVSGWGDPEAYRVVGADELKRAIRRVSPCHDPESTRYSLSGLLFEGGGTAINLVGTDGRRLATQALEASVAGGPADMSPWPVVPVKALKLVERMLGEGEVSIVLAANATTFKLPDGSTVHTRNVEGRFPKWREVFPSETAVAEVGIAAGVMLGATQQAAIGTSEESRGVSFDLTPGSLTLAAAAPDVGSATVDMLVEYDGEPVGLSLDHRYLSDVLKALDPSEVVTWAVIGEKRPFVGRTGDGYRIVIMPLTREGR